MQENYAPVREILPRWQGHGVRNVAVKFRGENGGEITVVEVQPAATTDGIDPSEVTDVVRAALDARAPYWAQHADVNGWLSVQIAAGLVTLWLDREDPDDPVVEQVQLGHEDPTPAHDAPAMELGEAPEDPLKGVKTLVPAWRASGTRAVTVQYEARGDEVWLTSASIRPSPTVGIVRHSVVTHTVREVLAGVLKRVRARSIGAVYIDVAGGTLAISQVRTRSGRMLRRRTIEIDTGRVLLA